MNLPSTLILLCLLGTIAKTETLEFTVRFADPTASRSADGFDRLTLPGLSLENSPGAPMLPAKCLNLLLPPGTRAVSVEAVISDERRIQGRFLPAPGRRETPLSEPPPTESAEPDRAIYESRSLYPAAQASIAHFGNMGGLAMASVMIFPVRYLGAERAVYASSEIRFSLRLARELPHKQYKYSKFLRGLARTMVENPSALDVWYPDRGSRPAKDEEADLLIVTQAPFDTVLQRLAEWKLRLGLSSNIVRADSIYAAVSGADRQEKIRNFIRDEHLLKGTGYVLLAGDTAVVPARVAFAMASGYDSLAPGRDSLRADLYYSDLDGSWNADGDGRYGELEDSIDMYPEVIVGRASINTLADAQTFVRKVMEYEQGAAWDHLGRASLWAEMLDYVTDGARGAEIIDRDHLIPFLKPAEKLYESLGNQTRASTIEAYRQGRHIVNHIGHAWYTSLNVGPGFTSEHEIRAGDFDTIPTGGRWGILYSIGCMPGAMERSCLAEHYVNSPDGGGVAFIGNCSYGWSLPYFSGYASSDLYNQRFFQHLLVEDSTSLGAAHAAAKAQFIGAAQEENEFRWVMYSLNLFGDPTLRVWTGEPESLAVACAESLPEGASSLEVTVHKSGRPLAGATVGVSKGEEYTRAITDGCGRAVLSVQAVSGDTLRLTATARNCLLAERAIPVTGSGSRISLLSWQISEIEGNADGLPGPGETLSLSFMLTNSGGSSLGDSIHCNLNRADSGTVVLDSAFAMPAPAPGESLWTGPLVSFLADSSLADGDFVLMGLSARDSAGQVWSFPVGLRLAAPSLCFTGYEVDDRAGNGNGVPEPGELVALRVRLKNKGLAALEGCRSNLSTTDPYLDIVSGQDSLGPVAPDSTAKASFEVYVDHGMPGPWRTPMFLIECAYGWKTIGDSFQVAAGQAGFSDDMETGSPGWYATPPESTEGGWHLSPIRSHSPVNSWYFGSEADTLMPAHSLDTLKTPDFVIGPSCSLSYWQWHDFAPGYSRGVVELCGDFGARLLQVVEGQSGGWVLSDHLLSGYQPGTVLGLRFIAYVDSLRSEGWYIDDVQIKGPPSGTSFWPPEAISKGFRLDPCHPNPCQGRTMIGFCLPRLGMASLKIYNVQGQLVRTLVVRNMTAGSHCVTWDGRDDQGRAVAGGIYLYRLGAGGSRETRKMVLLR